MAAVRRICGSELQMGFNIFQIMRNTKLDKCIYSTVAATWSETPKGRLKKRKDVVSKDLSRYAQIYPEFMPDPEPKYRQLLREKFERKDMIARRKVVDIPEFYVGSIVAVTISDIHAPGKSSRFMGICIEKRGCGLRANFTLRNIIDHQGIEVNYNMYDPVIQMIECLRLEKRLDDQLYYLRDASQEYSTFPVDMEQEILPEGSKVPINKTIVPLNPPPYTMKWERKDLKGIQTPGLGYKRTLKMIKFATPWEKYDLMKIYRETIPDEDRLEIFREVHEDLDLLEKDRRKKIRSVLISRSNKK